jgi:hypothetical protein
MLEDDDDDDDDEPLDLGACALPDFNDPKTDPKAAADLLQKIENGQVFCCASDGKWKAMSEDCAESWPPPLPPAPPPQAPLPEAPPPEEEHEEPPPEEEHQEPSRPAPCPDGQHWREAREAGCYEEEPDETPEERHERKEEELIEKEKELETSSFVSQLMIASTSWSTLRRNALFTVPSVSSSPTPLTFSLLQAAKIMFWMSLGIFVTTVELVGLGIPGVSDKGVAPSPSMESSLPCAYL